MPWTSKNHSLYQQDVEKNLTYVESLSAIINFGPVFPSIFQYETPSAQVTDASGSLWSSSHLDAITSKKAITQNAIRAQLTFGGVMGWGLADAETI